MRIVLALLASFCLAAIIFLLVGRLSQEQLSQAPQVKAQQQSESRLQPQEHHEQQAQNAQESSPRIPEVITKSGKGEGEGDAGEGREHGTEFWPAFYGYRLKVTDTLLVSVTFLLFWATLALWLSTRRLVSGAEKTSERQLRAYISANPKLVFNWRHETHGFAVGIDIENHGQTVGFNITYDFAMYLLDSPLPDGFVWPEPDRKYDQNNSLFPRTIVPVRLFFGRMLTLDEITEIESGKKRFHTWGTMHYRDAFECMRTTLFSLSFGGPDFANSMKGVPGANWNWDQGERHNDAT